MNGPASGAVRPAWLAEAFDEDYDALRHGVGGRALRRDALRVSGADALEYLQGQCSQDLIALEDGGSADALVLSPQGKLDALVRVTRFSGEELIVDVDSGFGEALALRLGRFKLRVKAVIEPMSWKCVSLRGPGAKQAFGGPASAGIALVVPYEWNGVVGVDLLGEAPELPAEVRSCGPEAWESVRVEAGIPVMGTELDERTIAAEADLLERCVSLTKGCYTGQELVARLDARGNRVARRLRGLVLDSRVGAGDLSGITRGAEVLAGGKSVGSVTSAAWSPALGTVVAMGYLHRDVVPPCPVEVRGDVLLAAEARELPLV